VDKPRESAQHVAIGIHVASFTTRHVDDIHENLIQSSVARIGRAEPISRARRR
jgi:hypothetical protein